MKKIFIFMVLMLIFLSACSSLNNPTSNVPISTTDETKKSSEQIAQEYHDSLIEFAKKNNISNYVLDDDERLNGFSIDKQKALEGKMFVLYAHLSDIYSKENKTYAVFKDILETTQYILECSDNTADKIKQENGEFDEDLNSSFFIAASIESVDKLDYAFNINVETADTYSSDTSIASITVLRGSCLIATRDN